MYKYTAQRQEEQPAWELGDISTLLNTGDMDTSKRNLLSNEERIRDKERKGKGKGKYSSVPFSHRRNRNLTPPQQNHHLPTHTHIQIFHSSQTHRLESRHPLVYTRSFHLLHHKLHPNHHCRNSFPNTHRHRCFVLGSCTKASRINAACHVFINILSTALLGCSNYVMQCLRAPTRDMVDRAHARGKALDVGVPRYRNLLSVGWRRLGLFAVLWASSFPLHFL